MNPVALLRHVDDHGDRYDAIVLWCPGCEYERDDEPGRMRGGLHMLPVNGDGSKRPTWDWNGDLEQVTLSPSVLTRVPRGETQVELVCHSFLRNGQWEFLTDSTHELSGQTVAMVELPAWVVR